MTNKVNQNKFTGDGYYFGLMQLHFNREENLILFNNEDIARSMFFFFSLNK